ncbi:MAG: hypothetical protein NVSMB49_26770 [Ktedonobacteraceae bacterium]
MRSTPGVLIVPLEHEFGWSRATISLAVSINLFIYGLSGPFIVALMERFGIRRIMVVALLVVAIAAGLTTIMQASWQLDLLWGVMVGLDGVVLLIKSCVVLIALLLVGFTTPVHNERRGRWWKVEATLLAAIIALAGLLVSLPPPTR